MVEYQEKMREKCTELYNMLITEGITPKVRLADVYGPSQKKDVVSVEIPINRGNYIILAYMGGTWKISFCAAENETGTMGFVFDSKTSSTPDIVEFIKLLAE